MKKVVVNNKTYELIKEYKNGFDEQVFLSKITEDFDDYEYIVGDWAYNVLRLKGFYNSTNPHCKKYNNIDKVDDYIKNNCAYECRYFILKS